MTTRLLLALALLVAGPTGCATIAVSIHDEELEPYSGTVADAWILESGLDPVDGALQVLAVADLPLSFLLDTLLLPISLPLWLAR